MSQNPEWIEIKREYEINSDGEKILKKVTADIKNKPFEKKERYDLGFKIIGVLAIALPLFLSFFQRQTEIEKQRSLFELNIVTQTVATLHQLEILKVSDNEYNKLYSKTFYELKPTLSLLNNKRADSLFNYMNQIQDFIEKYTLAQSEIDSNYYILLRQSLQEVKFPNSSFENLEFLKQFIYKSVPLTSPSLFEKINIYCQFAGNYISKDSNVSEFIKSTIIKFKDYEEHIPNMRRETNGRISIKKKSEFLNLLYDYSKAHKNRLNSIHNPFPNILSLEIKNFEEELKKSNQFLNIQRK